MKCSLMKPRSPDVEAGGGEMVGEIGWMGGDAASGRVPQTVARSDLSRG